MNIKPIILQYMLEHVTREVLEQAANLADQKLVDVHRELVQVADDELVAAWASIGVEADPTDGGPVGLAAESFIDRVMTDVADLARARVAFELSRRAAELQACRTCGGGATGICSDCTPEAEGGSR